MAAPPVAPFRVRYGAGAFQLVLLPPGASEAGIERAVALATGLAVGTFGLRDAEGISGFHAGLAGDWDAVLLPGVGAGPAAAGAGGGGAEIAAIFARHDAAIANLAAGQAAIVAGLAPIAAGQAELAAGQAALAAAAARQDAALAAGLAPIAADVAMVVDVARRRASSGAMSTGSRTSSATDVSMRSAGAGGGGGGGAV